MLSLVGHAGGPWLVDAGGVEGEAKLTVHGHAWQVAGRFLVTYPP